jgi:hypothetical protein
MSENTPPSRNDLARLLDQLEPIRAAGVENAVELALMMEKHPVKVANLKTSVEGDDRLRVTYDLSNQDPRMTLTGRCNIALVTREGAIIDITPSSRGVLSFQINRFRKMDILARIPPDIQQNDVIHIQVSAQANDLPLYYKQFPVTLQ